MRHRVDHRKLNRTASHRKAMLCNMVTSLFVSERITTTDAKAKEARRLAEKLITRARKGYTAHQEGLSLREAGKDDEAQQMEAVALAHWRQAGRYVRKTSVLRKLFEVIAPQFLEREGGYTRIIKMNRRLGDNARTVLLELVGTEKTEKPASKKTAEEREAEKKTEAKSKDKKPSKAAESKPKEKAKAKAKGKAKSKSKSGAEKEAADKSDESGKKTKAKTKEKAKPKGKSSGKKKPKDEE
jgi:large subunit ribosomal protein L17